MKIFVFVPCYNCENQISRVIADLVDDVIARIEKIVIVDNVSSDQTVRSAREAIARHKQSAKFELRVNERNLGLGGSFRRTVLQARQDGFTHFIVLHGDHQADPADLKLFLDRLENQPELDALLGSRFMSGSKRTGYSFKRRWANAKLNLLLSVLSRTRIHDLGSGLNLYNLAILDQNFLSSLPSHIAFDLVLLMKLLDEKRRIQFLPIAWRSTDEVSTIDEVQVGLMLLKMIIRRYLWPRSRS